MERRDYLLREIEKIGLLMRAILNHLMNKEENFALKINKKFDETTEQLLFDTGFDLKKSISMNQESFIQYISSFKGMNTGNLELLADIMFQYGTNESSYKRDNCMRKALQLYEFCNNLDKTYSFARENKVEKVLNELNDIRP
ncbi:MAG: hypothetical protein CVT92_07185 [Bacteroidetes bacterium HGW-Bacteroidetes-1]|jgi:hypothetical protein|nr:MAG: hypothetical protein CVT92_07185 [Bacteroidetes bacterium HGW-Bacteroidetes-1]